MNAHEYRIEDLSQRSALTIRSDAGCVAVSWIVDGIEMLALPAPLAEFLAAARTGGIPLLYPYANRLRSAQFTAGNRAVDLSTSATLKRDSTGLPMHGLLLRWSQWECRAHAHSFEARLDWRAHASLMEAYPFAHTLELRWELTRESDDAVLAITTTIHADGGCDVPWAFGWHPYFALDGDARLEVPARRVIALDSRGLPVLDAPRASLLACATTAARAGQDELYEIEVASCGRVALRERTITVEFGSDYPFMQVYSPANAAFASLEPMVAQTSALSDGSASLVAAGSSRSARFALRVHANG